MSQLCREIVGFERRMFGAQVSGYLNGVSFEIPSVVRNGQKAGHCDND